jgi:hypothetical protein
MMKKLIALMSVCICVVILSSHTNKRTDEGMFLLSDIRQINLKKIGLKMAPQELYNPNGTSLIDAIVRVGGCTGSFISNEGLIVTNHHCAFGFVQGISTAKNNYIKEGFLAKSRGEEVLAKGLVCKITASYEDVSARVLAQTESIADPNERLQRIAANIKEVTAAETKAHPDLQCEISEMFTGRTYTLFRYKLLKDVRLVYVPARSIGEYGGEKDNWVWPRHSGDFAFLRAYVAPDGSAAEYSEKNVPYKPAKFLKVNPKGVKENDFVFVLGYPGRTFRHQPAAFYRLHEQYQLKYISDLYDWQISYMEEKGKDNDSIAIHYAGRIKSLANVTKNYKGKLQGFKRAGLTGQKYRDEEALQQFVMADPKLKETYGNVIPRINELYNEIIGKAPSNMWYTQLYNNSPAIGFASTISIVREQYLALGTAAEKKAFIDNTTARLKTALNRYKSSYDPAFDKAFISKMLLDAQSFKGENKIEWVASIQKDMGTQGYEGFMTKLMAQTSITQFEKLEKWLDSTPDSLLLMNDPLVSLAGQLYKEMAGDEERKQLRDAELNRLMAQYVDMKSAWKNKQFIPDANGTLRFTYGHIKGYWPNDADYNAPFTTLKGVIEKEDGKDYELMDVIRQLYAAKDYGTFMHPDLNDLPVNILYDLDTTGGNSGSPVMNAKGELIGVNFDRAYTATINDYAWNESYSRSVAVDIRYVLWVVQKVAKADYLLGEMGVK